MSRIKKIVKAIFTPITVMIIPHSSLKPLRMKLPSIGLIVLVTVWVGVSIYIAITAVRTEQYSRMKDRLGFYSTQFSELRTTMDELKKSEFDFRKIFALGTKDDILENLDTSYTGSIDMEVVKKQIKKAMESVADIKDYLSEQRDIYMATPKGWPVSGHITSGFGYRINPITHTREFHTGLDIMARAGSPVMTTADGIVSYAGWSGANGNLVVIEHGFGYTTAYAHNKKIIVKVGQKVKRGDVIAYEGSTGRSTGPHSHYEVWIDRKPVNPKTYLGG
ncbi:murein DD-endopeptidase MepM [bacterium BMS3Abin07]|nr:murein DD-endopeptidase MepM [bacterium BMS3Abin07]